MIKGLAIISTWWMARLQTLKKDVASCEMPRLVASILRPWDVLMRI